MTLAELATADCPACGAEFMAEILASVNVSMDSTLKPRVLDGSLFDHVCPACGELSRLVHSTLYHDMDRRFQVWLRPEGDAPDPITAAMFEGGPVGEGYSFRWVERGDELAEKVHVFGAGLDDRIVELVKVWTLARIDDLHGRLFFVGKRRHWFRTVLEFVRPVAGEMVTVRFANYEHARARYGSKLRQDPGWQKIDQRFALDVMGFGGRPLA